MTDVMRLDVSSGALYRFDGLARYNVPARPVFVWRPDDAIQDPKEPRPVLYMHDGDKVFRSPGEGTGNWGVPETVTRLAAAGEITAPIVVAVAATDNRAGEYMPEKPLSLPKADLFYRAHRDRVYIPRADAYLRFIVDELKPWVDSTWNVRTDQANTLMMGCSRAGLISVYAVAEYPHVFGAAACLSTHWPHGDGIVIDWLEGNLPPAGSHRLYFDYGDQGLDAEYAPYQARMDQLLRRLGYRAGRDWVTRHYPGHGHSEEFWRARLADPMMFLFGSRISDAENPKPKQRSGASTE